MRRLNELLSRSESSNSTFVDGTRDVIDALRVRRAFDRYPVDIISRDDLATKWIEPVVPSVRGSARCEAQPETLFDPGVCTMTTSEDGSRTTREAEPHAGCK